MNKRIDLTKLGGYPLAQEDLDWLQSSYRDAFAAMADMVGDGVILAGMVEGGGAVTAGWISLGGELVPFEAGAIGTGEFIIDELVTPLIFENGISKDVLYKRVAKFSAGGANQYANLKRISTIKTGLVPKGLISMWSGDVGQIPAGWALCDGSGGSPDLSGKFIVGYNNGDLDYSVIGNTGGEKAHLLTIAEMPAHAHPINNRSNSDTGSGKVAVGGDAIEGPAPITDVIGGGVAHENRPPYYVLAYIIKL